MLSLWAGGNLLPCLHLGDLFANGVHIETIDLADQVLKGRGRESALLLENANAVAEGHEGGDSGDAKAGGQRLLILGVDLAEHNIGVSLGGLFEDRAELAARAAPRRPEVKKNGALLDRVVEVLCSDGDGCHIYLSYCEGPCDRSYE